VIDSSVTADGTGAPQSLDASRPGLDAAVQPPSLAHDAGQTLASDALANQEPVAEAGTVVPPTPTDGSVSALSTPLPSDGDRGSVCYADHPCDKDLFCYAPTGGGIVYPGICTDGCRTNANCPAVGGIPQVCAPNGQCYIDCAGPENKGSGACPSNEICRDTRASQFVASAWRCTYPDGAGSRGSLPYGACSTQHGSGDCTVPNVCYVPTAAIMLPGRGQLPTGAPSSSAGYCTSECATAMDCPISPGTTAVPVCNRGRCELDCGAAGANTCPDKMNCRDIDENPLATTFRCIFLS